MKLLDQVRAKLRLLHYAWGTAQSSTRWIERYIRFHKRGNVWRHPADLSATAVKEFLMHLARDRQVSASTQEPSPRK
ncbi:integron integrase [Limnoglobus roseus]|uniref:Integron integrase n=1 Tax=Limnoglobus roseus TaxID=2598579 RepID=A0A5C1APV5_9BACT|nr:integron integrase [Limnoglobus roseus]